MLPCDVLVLRCGFGVVRGVLLALLLGVSAASVRADTPAATAPSAGPQRGDAPQVSDSDAPLQGVWSRPLEAESANVVHRWTFEPGFVTVETQALRDGAIAERARFRYELITDREPPELILYSADRLQRYRCVREKEELFLTQLGAGKNGTQAKPLKLTRGHGPSVGELREPLLARAIGALVDRDGQRLRALAGDPAATVQDERGAIRSRIADDHVELQIRGRLVVEPGALEFAEFIASSKDKSYESLMVCSEPELQRLALAAKFFQKLPMADRRHRWTAQILWVDGTEPRLVELSQLLHEADAAKATTFLDGMQVENDGSFGGETSTGLNLAVDKKLLPDKQADGTLVLRLLLATP